MAKPEPPGFQRLLDVDMKSGWMDGTSTLLVPQRLAAQINEARRALRFRSKQADAWVEACVQRKAEATESDDDAAAPPAASPPPAPAAPPPARVRPRHGRKVFEIGKE